MRSVPEPVGEPVEPVEGTASATNGRFDKLSDRRSLASILCRSLPTYEALWKNEMYPGEYMYFLSKLGPHVSMIEFEVPGSERDNIVRWQEGFTSFALAVCVLPMNEQA